MKSTAGELNFTRKVLITITIVTCAIIFLFLMWQVIQVVLLFFGSILFAIFLDACAAYGMQKIRVSKTISLVLVLVLLCSFFFVFFWIASPRIGNQFNRLTERIPEATEKIKILLSKNDWFRKALSKASSPQQYLPLGSNILGNITGFFSSAIEVILSFTIVFIVGLYMAFNPRVYIQNTLRLFPIKKRARIAQLFDSMGSALRWWLLGRISSMLVVGILTFIGLLVIDLPLAFSLGLIAALLSFIPYIGPFLSVVPAILVAMAESPVNIIYVIMVYVSVQALEGNLVTPLIQERAVSLPPALLITAQLLMGVLFGLTGIFLSTPLAVVLIVTVQMLYVEDVLHDKVKIMGTHYN